MSNSTRPGGYDERLVVPLEASRRGAHRARTNPLVAALPLLAVIVVVAAVIGVAYALFIKPGGDPAATDQVTTTNQPGATSAPPSPPASHPATGTSPSTSASSSGAKSPSAAPVSTSIPVAVYNGTSIAGLAKRAANVLVAAGYKKANVIGVKWGVPVTGTTIFYSKESELPNAEAVAKVLKVGKPALTTRDTGGGVVVVTGTDADSVLPR